MKVTLLNFTPNPEKTIVLAAKLCYSDSNISQLEDKAKGVSYEKFLGKIIKMGHLSVLEHASFTFGIEGISRATSHQLVRHRLASYSQQSQRYVKFKEPEFVIPSSIKKDAKNEKRFSDTIESLYSFYKEMLDAGIPAEDARYILPNAATTKIIATMNARELLHFFGLRTCERAQWEIRDMAKRMLSLVKKEAPFIFSAAGPGCVSTGKCTEGEMTCGRPDEIRKEFKKI
ncbi:MAG: FAD-dependent thymidylate synthase [Deltaproteobacteria bacterium GWC2_42_51]|nr:MAG: FAD-dependent thymidylate synthase [Deltaproteobacteria bacterium GWA2_42_85]OGP31106.1 MAG: FAD-dependent thymidylate synthase [Deltaproteobacteria bacterium GWC2_42_51]OGP48770.1 MAG: FAD-dependent thymidylate synthase [Deltaproteobacteria bacterium GWF2_42_12]OGQ24944.1 MAG: FAD-dependent thymidylate synthase [Deltaproteobacteria bacterium RIFCSPHIGHO2_02_FULL_42_44]OGQ37432.1 MAG: FAD-dependent thymidylate synthase [Deltaproteobacteria bacterium RIFCSPLOWO2_02_FULL_42_39]OGQ68731.1